MPAVNLPDLRDLIDDLVRNRSARDEVKKLVAKGVSGGIPMRKLEKALRALDPDRCMKALLAVDDAVLAARRNAPLAPAICERVVLQVAQQAGRRR